MAAATSASGAAASTPPSFLDALGAGFLTSAGSIEAQLDAEGVAKRLLAEEKLSSRAGQRTIAEMKDLCRRVPGAVVATQGAVAAICRAVVKLSPGGAAEDEDDDAVEPLQDSLEMLAILIGEITDEEAASQLTGPASRRALEVAELIVRYTENGKGLLRLLSARDVSTEFDAMVLIQRIYRRLPAPIDAALLADPLSLGHLMQTLQNCQIDYVRNECLSFLILLTASNKDIQTIVTVQNLVETLFYILEDEELQAGGRVAWDLVRCLTNLVGNTTCQKYIRETGGMASFVNAMATALSGKRPGKEVEEEEDDGFGGRANDIKSLPDETRWACLMLLTDATLVLAGRGASSSRGASDGASREEHPEVDANRAALIKAGALELCRHLGEPGVSLVARLKIVSLLDVLTLSPLAAKHLQAYKDEDSAPVLVAAVAVVLGESADLPMRSALGRVVGRALCRHTALQSFLCSSLSPQLEMQPSVGVAPAGRQIVALLEDAASPRPSKPVRMWFALHLVHAMLHGNTDVQSVCVSMPVDVPSDAGPPENFLDLLLRAFSACVRACRGAAAAEALVSAPEELTELPQVPRGPETPAAVLVALLKLLVYWLSSCPQALVAFACSPVYVPLAVVLATSGAFCGSFFQVHVEGLASLLLGLCVGADDANVDVASLMTLLAEQVGIEEFQHKVDRLWRSEPLQRPPRLLADFRWYGSHYRAFVRERQRAVQRRMVQLYVAGSVGGGSAAISEDIADHYKQIIRVQDAELSEVRKENDHLRGEVEAFMRRGLQAKSSVLAEKMVALQGENEALHSEVILLEQDVAARDAGLARDRLQLRTAVNDLEQQLQSMAVGYEQLECASEASSREVADLRAKLAAERARAASGGVGDAGGEGAAAAALEAAGVRRRCGELEGERDDLLELLGRLATACPEVAAPFVAPLGKCPASMLLVARGGALSGLAGAI